MKTHILYRIIGLFFLMTGWIAAHGQDQMEVPGDNFSLEGALELFKKSGSPEEFERMLNDPESRVNNLDLNGDGYIDYIRVIDRYEGNVHAFILQAVVSQREYQDIAVITLEKLANGKAVLQIIGDEDIYGIETIIEPTREVRTYGGTRTTYVSVNVWAWPFVRYVYGPHYSVWISPWGWHARPYWWSPWRPIAYYDYYPYWHPYRPYYRVWHTHRVVYAERLYRPHRATSVIVHNRYNRHITTYRSSRIDNDGRYRSRSDRSNARQATTSVRYNSNGRIISDRSTSSRTSANTGTRTRSVENNARSSVSPRTERSYDSRSSGNNQRSSSSPNVERSTERSSGSAGNNRSAVTPRTDRSNSIGSSGSNQRSSSSPNVQRSTERSSGSAGNNRSAVTPRSDRSYSSGSSGSNQRSSSSPNVQRSTERSSGGAGTESRSSSSNSRGRR